MALTVRTPGLVLTEHEFDIPLDHAQPQGETISVFAREVADPDGLDKPFLVYLQGGPGFEAPRPTRYPASSGWMDFALDRYRVLMLDQRGTGRSTPVGPATLAGRTPQQQADYLKHFRADAIVRDAEFIRQALGVERWCVLGQSFGGFTALNYLSQAPESLAAVYFTGGLPPIGLHPDEIYAATFRRTLERNHRYYQRYPQDAARVRELLALVQDGAIELPDGEKLSWRRFRQHGDTLGASHVAELLHQLIETPFDSPAFAHDVAAPMGFERNPIYAVLHEACYADGFATRWSAERVQPAEYAGDPTLFTGEHVFSWMLDDYRGLRPFKEAAQILAGHEWPKLYDPDVLAHNEVPAAAAVYAEDLYVESEFSMQTAAAVRGLRPWLTNEYEHNALRADGATVLARLIDLAHGKA